MEQSLHKYNFNFTRIEAIDGNELVHEVETASVHTYSNDIGDAIVFSNSNDTWIDGAVPTKSEAACAMSHLKAIRRAYEDGNEVAIIFEDDVAFDDTMPLYRDSESLPHVLNNAYELEANFSILQLHWIFTAVSNESVIDRDELLRAYTRGELVVRRDRFPRLENTMCGGRVLWSALAYAIRRPYMKLLLETFLPHYDVDSGPFLQSNQPTMYNFMTAKRGSYSIQADCFIYSIEDENIKKSLVVTRPMFMYPKGNAYSTTMDNRDVGLKSQFRRKKIHDESRNFIEDNFIKVDIGYIRLQPVLYIMNTQYTAHHNAWVANADLMFKRGTVRSLSTINEFNSSRLVNSVHNEKLLFLYGDDMLVVFPYSRNRAAKGYSDTEISPARNLINDFISYTKVIRVFLGDGFPYTLLLKDSLPLVGIYSVRDFDFPLELRKRKEKAGKENYFVAKVKFNETTIGFLVSHSAAANFFDETGFFGGAVRCSTHAPGNAMIGGGYLDFSNFLFPNNNVPHHYMHSGSKNSFDYFVENLAHFVGVEVSEIDVPSSLLIDSALL
eukprot:g7546.t1